MLLITELKCEDCQKVFSLEDNLEKNKANISKPECKDYLLSLIKKAVNYNFEYTVIFNCKNCNNFNINKVFNEKEIINYIFKCNNCNLKGLSFSYFLSNEEDPNIETNVIKVEKEDEKIDKSIAPPIDINSDNMNPKAINQLSSKEDIPDSKKKELNNNQNNIAIPYSEINKRVEKISAFDVNQMKIKSEQINKKIKHYSTPVGIDIIFVKNYTNYYKLSFLDTDSISSQIETIRQKIDLGENPSYYYNGVKIDINKSFKENQIYNNSYIEIED